MTRSRETMIEQDLRNRGVSDERVLSAMSEVDRALFLPEELRNYAYDDRPLPIGEEQTASQPYIVAYMAEALGLGPEDRVLEIGGGCGYNAAVMSRIAKHVFSIEIVESLAERAQSNLQQAGITKVSLRHGDGHAGWPEEAPFDAVILTAAPATEIPETLKNQLRIGGRMIAPVGTGTQRLLLLEKTGEAEFEERELLPVRFVPMTGGNRG